MKLVITGASGNIGSSIVEAASTRPGIEEIVGIARRRPTWDPEKTRWIEADVTDTDLVPLFEGADAVVHLAWAIQPSRDIPFLDRTNIEGSRRVFAAVRAAGVPKLIYSSSVGAYSPGPVDRPVDEEWPVEGVPTSTYSRQKAAVESELDRFERQGDEVAVIRIRPGLVFKRDAASEIRRLFAGPFLPGRLLRPGRLPIAPAVAGLRIQAVHSSDVAQAFLNAAESDVKGAFNLAAEPPLDQAGLADAFESRTIQLPEKPVRALAAMTWKLRLQPSEPGWLDLAMKSPLMSSARARSELDWAPRFSATEALAELLRGLSDGEGHSAPHLVRTSVAGRIGELGTGVGQDQIARGRRRQIIKYLTDAHSIEKQALIQMKYAPRMAGHAEMAAAFSRHQSETEKHMSTVADRLRELRSRPAPTKDMAGAAGALPMLLFARVQVDAPGKLAAHAYSYEHMEAAVYGILAALAERSGDLETQQLAARILEEELLMASRVEAGFDGVVDLALEATWADGDSLLRTYVVDAVALASQGEGFYRHAANRVDDPGLARVFASSLAGSERSNRQLAAQLEGLGGPTSSFKPAALRAGGNAAGILMGAQPDPITKLAGFAYAFQHIRIAGFELLARVASATGSDAVNELALSQALEERTSAREIAGTWDRLGGV